MLINNTLDGYLKDIEIKGNTWQDSENLADIRSVGDKVEGQELYKIDVVSTGKNLFNGKLENGYIYDADGSVGANTEYCVRVVDFIRVNPNTAFTLKCNSANMDKIYYYDKDKNFISLLGIYSKQKTVVTPSNCSYIKVRFYNDSGMTPENVQQFQIEEGTVATPYEPYKEDKLTILSPTPLEKVGDIADRIICKDGVWGIEKNIGEVVLNDEENWSYRHSNDAFYFYQVKLPFNTKNQYDNKLITNKYIAEVDWGKQYEYCFVNEYNGLVVSSSISTLNEFKDSLKAIPLQVYYQTAQPQFIPLPNSQQIKLRTFADRTNIHFETEIEPTIKAQVPKSLGATVNTHTTQIDNLNKELDRVKKLEESTVSTVTSDRAFTTVAETTGGYFEDVKIEGKTLVNLLCRSISYYRFLYGTKTDTHILYNNPIQEDGYAGIHFNNTIEAGKTYTLIIDIDDISGAKYSFTPSILYSNISADKFESISPDFKGLYVSKVIATGNVTFQDLDFKANNRGFRIGVDCIEGGSFSIKSVVILEGDHTDKDLNFFEGLKSVGQDSDEISVESVNENLLNYTGLDLSISGRKALIFEPIKISCTVTNNLNNTIIATVQENGKYKREFKVDGNAFKYIELNYGEDLSRTELLYSNGFDSSYEFKNGDICIAKGNNNKACHIPRKSDKKEILYFNPPTQTWEKPVLREWDSIEKRGNKYYYHKRSEEVVLNGSEHWENSSANAIVSEGYTIFNSTILHGIQKSNSLYVVNNFSYIPYDNGFRQTGDLESISDGGAYRRIFVRIKLSKLSSSDIEGFKTWLQANNVTLVYELAQEEVYECTNLDLITYPNETNLIVNSGAIQPKLELKVHSNISNVVKLLQEKISILESDINKYMISQNRSQLDATYKSDSVTFKIDYVNSSKNMTNDYSEDLYNLILDNILVGKDNYNYNHMFNLIMDYASWNKITWEQFDELVLLMDLQHNPIEELPEELN